MRRDEKRAQFESNGRRLSGQNVIETSRPVSALFPVDCKLRMPIT